MFVATSASSWVGRHPQNDRPIHELALVATKALMDSRMLSDSASSPPLLSMAGIGKRFPGVVALDGVSLDLRGGEVLALMGENGAGKSTLMKILGGAYSPDAGTIRLNGEEVAIRHVVDAKKRGIAVIHQELLLAPNLSIAANIYLGNEKLAGGHVLKRGEMNDGARALLKRLGLNAPPSMPVSSLTVGQMQLVEIAKAMLLDARIIVMDEPTASLTAGESERLFALIEELKRDGRSIIYISHRIPEVLRLSDRIVVLRDGKNAGEILRADASAERIVSMMVGRPLSAWFPKRREAEELLDDVSVGVRDLMVPGARGPVSFDAHAGEILGFAGLVGAGRTELMQTLFGVTPALAGTITLGGQRFVPKRPRDAIDRGVYLAPEDRKHHGLVLPMSVAQNTSLPDIGHYSKWKFLRRDREKAIASETVKSLRVRTPTIRQRVKNLSGGNQQKIVLGKWLAMRPRVLILDEPTRGVDVGAKAEIYEQIIALARRGITILMVSSDMEEILGLSDRVAVMHERKLIGVVDRDRIDQESLGKMMTGQIVG